MSQEIQDGGTLRLTDDGLEMPEPLKGYVGQFEIRTGAITGQINTTDEGMPTDDFYDGVIAVYPEGGDYNEGLDDGEIVFQIRGHPDIKYTVIDERTEDD